MPKGCAGPRDTGKPLQIAVDGVPDTTEARQLVRFQGGKAEVELRGRQGKILTQLRHCLDGTDRHLVELLLPTSPFGADKWVVRWR